MMRFNGIHGSFIGFGLASIFVYAVTVAPLVPLWTALLVLAAGIGLYVYDKKTAPTPRQYLEQVLSKEAGRPIKLVIVDDDGNPIPEEDL